MRGVAVAKLSAVKPMYFFCHQGGANCFHARFIVATDNDGTNVSRWKNRSSQRSTYLWIDDGVFPRPRCRGNRVLRNFCAIIEQGVTVLAVCFHLIVKGGAVYVSGLGRERSWGTVGEWKRRGWIGNGERFFV